MSQPASFTVPTWTLGDRLDKALRHKGIKAHEMAAMLHKSPNTISNYVNGHTAPDHPTLVMWAEACDVWLEWLEHGTEPGPQLPPKVPAPPTTQTPAAARLAEQKRRRVRSTVRYLADAA